MPIIAAARSGHQVLVKQRPVKFSYWPMSKTTRRYGLQTSIFVQNPWTIISSSITNKCPAANRDEARAYIEQARDFYVAASSEKIVSAKPLLLYYCFMNIAKAYILTFGACNSLNRARHGLSEQIIPSGTELRDAYLEAHRSTPSTINIFGEFYAAVVGQPLPASARRFDLTALLPQVVAGHRLWMLAAKSRERFLPIDSVDIMENESSNNIWLNLQFLQEDFNRITITHRKLLIESRLQSIFREVRQEPRITGRVCFEQKTPLSYSHIAADEIQNLVTNIRKNIWTIVASVPPYRKYYVYLSPSTETAQVLPQLLAIYGITYYLGSITRYRPHHFDRILTSPYGPFIEEFVSSQPIQFIYLMASDFAMQEVIKPAIL